MAIDLFAEIHVADYDAARSWYMRLFGAEPSFIAHDTECVWGITDHGWIAIDQQTEHAGHSAVTMFVDDLDAVVAAIAARGIEPVLRETYGNGVRKVVFRDPDGNEIGYGGAPVTD